MDLAKPTLCISVEEHTQHVGDEMRNILASRPFVCEKYLQRTGKDLKKRALAAAKYHDIGKKHKIWQDACRKDFEIFQKTGMESKMHNLRNANFRHEIASLQNGNLKELSEVVKAAIAAHHGKLSECESHRWENERQRAGDFWRLFKGLKNGVVFSEMLHIQKLEESIKKRYEFSGPRGLLQLADHRASARESGEKNPEIMQFHYNFPFKDEKGNLSKRGVQNVIDELKNKDFAILRAPTGSGKTDAALLWAKYQVEESKKADRLVIAMPTRFTANALSIATAENLSQIGLYHSSAWFQRTKDIDLSSSSQHKQLIDKEQELARLLETPITITTIDHLCICLTGTREDHHTIFFNLAHSCVVIDEADFYDEFTQFNIIVLLHALRLLKVPVLLMSATVPSSAKGLYAQSGFKIEKIYEDVTDAMRIRCNITQIGEMSQPGDISEILKRGLEGQPMIIYANTVARAQEYCKWFFRQSQEFTNQNVVLYHSRFTEPDKALIEECLCKMLGKEAWKKQHPKGIAILTQIGELSVNISTDLMLSDLCPIDRLAQRVGRLSRFYNKKGDLFLIKPCKRNSDGGFDFYPAPYGHFSGKHWEISHAMKESMKLLIGGEYSAKTFVELVDTLYATSSKDTDYSILGNKKELEDLMIANWLILPAEEVEHDDDHTQTWKSRDIDYQYTVYVGVDTFDLNYYFPNVQTFREFKIRHGVQCYAYEFQRAKEEGKIDATTFCIGDESTIQLWLVRRNFYNSKLGLCFDIGEEGKNSM